MYTSKQTGIGPTTGKHAFGHSKLEFFRWKPLQACIIKRALQLTIAFANR